ncbi:MAG: hypothetical protein K2P98_01820 [Neisseriaceae bacterium]|nr:hypothetical protein [Neisseriaceae bacterium]
MDLTTRNYGRELGRVGRISEADFVTAVSDSVFLSISLGEPNSTLACAACVLSE